MASQLVRQKWPVHDNFPEFYEDLEEAQGKLGTIKTPLFSKYVNPIGIEIEIEGWCGKPADSICFWELREDGSLKDHGIEFVSSILSGELIDYAIEEFFRILSWHTQKFNPVKWSHRTSIHVHANLRDLPVLKLKWLIAYFALTEPLWYQHCDEKRIGNSFCFPICSMNSRSIRPGKEWPKYCGFNLGSSLTQFNTVEFRQMHGHQDRKLYILWIKKVCDFIHYIYHTPTKTLREQMEAYLNTGNVSSFGKAFRDTLPKNFTSLVYDNAKWVADYIYKGTK